MEKAFVRQNAYLSINDLKYFFNQYFATFLSFRGQPLITSHPEIDRFNN